VKMVRIFSNGEYINAVQNSKNHCGANDLSVTVTSNRRNVMKNVCGFFIFEQRLDIVLAYGEACGSSPRAQRIFLLLLLMGVSI
jgi:hypothetical protein